MRSFDKQSTFKTPVSFNKPRPENFMRCLNKPCPVCHEDCMGCDRYGCWRLTSNSKSKPKYSLKLSLLIGGCIAVAMLVALGVVFGY